MEKNVFKIINRVFFILLIFLLVWSYFARNNYRSVDIIHSDVVKEPVQLRALEKTPIKISNNDYEYTLTPLFEYEINGLIVHKMDYRWFSIYKMDSVFPMDLCLLWGDNVASKVYQSKKLSFSQDARFAYWKWYGNINFNHDEAANIHLIMKNEELERKLKTLSCGDQVKIKGQLVDVIAENKGKPGRFDPEEFRLKSSTKRTDTGAGACEIIYVDSFEILEKANILPNTTYKFSLFLLIISIFGKILWYILRTKREVDKLKEI